MDISPGHDIDRLMVIKAVKGSPGFELLREQWQREKERLTARMLDEKTSNEETLQIKYSLRVLDTVSPDTMVERLLNAEMNRLRRAAPELVRSATA